MTRHLLAAACAAALVAACGGSNGQPVPAADPAASAAADPATRTAANGQPFAVEQIASFNEPWAMTFLPDGRLLVTEKPGILRLYDPERDITGEISGVPAVAYGGQGGFGDVVPHPGFADNGIVYLNNTGGVVQAHAHVGRQGPRRRHLHLTRPRPADPEEPP